jgi:hypothetical protein
VLAFAGRTDELDTGGCGLVATGSEGGESEGKNPQLHAVAVYGGRSVIATLEFLEHHFPKWVIGHLLVTQPYPLTYTADTWHAKASAAGFVQVGISDMWTAIALSELRRALMLAVLAAVLLTPASGFGAQPNGLLARQARNAYSYGASKLPLIIAPAFLRPKRVRQTLCLWNEWSRIGRVEIAGRQGALKG